MPSSQLTQLQQIMELILFTNPQTMLDIGVGFGKYGFLSREYLEIWGAGRKYSHWAKRIDGIEVFKGYLTPVHDFIYDNIYIGNALEVLHTTGIVYDLILLIDVLEHFNYEEGLNLLEMCRNNGRNIIISTPKGIGNQENIFENAHETHKFQWKKEHFVMFKEYCFLPNKYSIICYAGEYARRLKRARINRYIGKAFPFLISIVKRRKPSAKE